MSAAVAYGPLQRADGSVIYRQDGFAVLGAVNGPIEAQRRDELPEEAALEVIVRPAAGVPGIRERHFESLIQQTLQYVIRTRDHPRMLIQIILQVLDMPGIDEASGRLSQAASVRKLTGAVSVTSLLMRHQGLELLPHLLNASMVALLVAAIPLATTMTATLITNPAVSPARLHPSKKNSQTSQAAYVFAFNSDGEQILVESDGPFSMTQWQDAANLARVVCCGPSSAAEQQVADKVLQRQQSMQEALKAMVTAEIDSQESWRDR